MSDGPTCDICHLVAFLYRHFSCYLALAAPTLVQVLIYVLIVFILVCAALVSQFHYAMRPPTDDFIPFRYRAHSVKTDIRIPRCSEIYHIAFLLNQKLPADLIPVVLDYAEMWHTSHLASSRRLIDVTVPESGRICLVATLPQRFPRGAMRSLTFTTDSRDFQFWSTWIMKHDGPNKHSWFAVSVLPDDSTFQPDNQRLLYPAKRVLNDHHIVFHRDEWPHQTVRWHFHDEDPEVVEFLTNLAGGQKIALLMCADYEPYLNAVKSTMIECQVAVVRKM